MAKLPVAGLVWQSVEFLKKSWNLLSNFPDLEKVWKMEIVEIKYGKMVFSKLRRVLYNFFWFWSNLNRSRPYVCKKSFVPAIFMVFIDHLFDNLECGQREYCFGKKSWKSLEFWIHYSFYPAVAISWLCIWNFINSLCSMVCFYVMLQPIPRTIYQFHYTGWPDHGVPKDPSPVLHILHEVNSRQQSIPMAGPIIVHCRYMEIILSGLKTRGKAENFYTWLYISASFFNGFKISDIYSFLR